MKHAWLQAPWSRFLDRVRQDRLAHALLLSGPEGIGKRALALEMAARLLCLEPREVACGACRSCQLLASGAHPELTRIHPEQGKHQIPVAAIRALSGSLALSTSISPRKVAILAPAEAMNLNAANALLKSLEEPQGEAVLLLVSHDVSRLPVTIRSRCQALTATAPVREDAVAWVVAETDADAERASLALNAAGGRPLLAIDLLEGETLELYARLQSALGGLPGRPARASAVTNGLANADPVVLWSWLSACSAAALKALSGGEYPDWLPPSAPLSLAPVARLQQAADRNRQLSTSGVRQDLLLQEWLLEWAQQADNGSQRGGMAPGE